ncbi:MAG: ribosome maturation factor RimP [bacterium]
MTDMHSVLDKIEAVIKPFIEERHLELVDLEIAGANYLRIRIGKLEGDMLLDDIADVSRKIEELLDMSDVIQDKYVLEVSSPGIDRPLKKKEDFIRFAGKKVRVITREKINGTHLFTGKLIGMKEEKVLIEENQIVTEIAFDIIKKANIDVEDNLEKKAEEGDNHE